MKKLLVVALLAAVVVGSEVQAGRRYETSCTNCGSDCKGKKCKKGCPTCGYRRRCGRGGCKVATTGCQDGSCRGTDEMRPDYLSDVRADELQRDE